MAPIDRRHVPDDMKLSGLPRVHMPVAGHHVAIGIVVVTMMLAVAASCINRIGRPLLSSPHSVVLELERSADPKFFSTELAVTDSACRARAGWSEIPRPDLQGASYPPFASVQSITPTTSAPGTLFLGASDGLYKTVDCGRWWMPVGRFATIALVSVWVDGADRVFVSNHRDPLYVSFDLGDTWFQPKGAFADGSPTGTLRATIDAVSSNPDGSAYASSFVNHNDTFRRPPLMAQWLTIDGGVTWTVADGTASYPTREQTYQHRFARRVTAIDPRNPDVLYSVGDDGPQRSSDRGRTFEPFIRELRPPLDDDENVRKIVINRDGSRFWLLASTTLAPCSWEGVRGHVGLLSA